MKTFNEFLNFRKKSKEVRFIAPMVKSSENHKSAETKYGMIVDTGEAVIGLNKKTRKYDFGFIQEQSFRPFALKMVKNKTAVVIEEDDTWLWYGFLNGFGTEKQVEEYFKGIRRPYETAPYKGLY
jgi:hypothetical protein